MVLLNVKKGSDENNKYIYCLQKQNGDNIIILAIPRKDTIVQNLIKKYNLESNIKESPDNLKEYDIYTNSLGTLAEDLPENNNLAKLIKGIQTNTPHYDVYSKGPPTNFSNSAGYEIPVPVPVSENYYSTIPNNTRYMTATNITSKSISDKIKKLSSLYNNNNISTESQSVLNNINSDLLLKISTLKYEIYKLQEIINNK